VGLKGTDLALLTARFGRMRFGAFRFGFCPEDVEGTGTVEPGDYAWREVVPEDDGEEWHVVDAWSMCAEKCVAAFQTDPGPAVVGVAFGFYDMTTPTGEATYWHWDFGDGHSSDEQNPTHVYTHPGTFTVTFYSSSPRGMCSTAQVLTAVRLKVTFTWVAFWGDGKGKGVCDLFSTVTGGTPPYVYLWDCGLGIWASADPNPEWKVDINGYSNPQDFLVQVDVEDADLNTATFTDTVTIPFRPP
jgi:hypothetical protein